MPWSLVPEEEDYSLGELGATEPIAPRAYAPAPLAPPEEEQKPTAPPEEQKPSPAPTPESTPAPEGIVAVDPRVYPFGSILRDEKSGQLFLAGDKATQKSGETRQFSVVGKVAPDYMPKTPEQVRTLLDTVALSQGKQAQPSPHDIGYSGDLYPKIAKDREPLVAQVDKNPELKKFLAAAMSQEAGDDVAYLGAVESLFNRTQMQSGDIYKQLTNGFYGPINRGEVGRIYRNGVQPWMMQKLDKALDAVRNGSDLIEGRTDQGMRNEIVGPKAKFGSEYFGYMGGDPSWSIRHQREKGEPGTKGLRTASGPTEPSGPIPTEPSGPIGHDTAPDGTRPMGEGRYIWPGEKNPAQPAGEGKYIWPGAQRASPEEIAAAHAEAAAPPWATPLMADMYGLKSWRDLPGTSRTEFLGQREPSPSLYDRMVKPDPSLGGFHAAAAIPIYGYNPNPTPITGVPYAPSQPAEPGQVVQQPQPTPATSQMITTPEGVQVPDQWGFATFTQPGADQTAAPAPAPAPAAAPVAAGTVPPLAAGPTQAAAAAPEAKTPAGTQADLIDAANTFMQGGSADGILLAISSLDKLALNNLPAWKVLDPIRKNLESEHKQSEFLREKIRQGLPVDRDFQEKFIGEALHTAGMLAGTLPFYAVPGAGGLITTAQMYDMGRQDYVADREKKGLPVDEAAANRAGLKFLAPAGVAQYALNKSIVGKFLVSHAGQTKKEILVGLGKLAAHGGATFGGIRVWQNVVANALEGYDPDRPIGEGVLHDVGLGALMGVAGGAAGEATKAVRGRITTKKLEEGTAQLAGVEPPPVAPLTPEEKAAFEHEVPPETKPPPEEPPSGRAPTTPPTEPGAEVKPSLAMAEPAAPETVKIQAFDPKAREFVETEMKPTKELHEQLKREENSYQALIKCLEL